MALYRGVITTGMNYSVHSIMYFYYMLMALGARPSWGLAVTLLQIAQMVIGILMNSFVLLYIARGLECAVDRWTLFYSMVVYLSYFGLFVQFFVGRYTSRGHRGKNTKKEKKK
jgi:elongation of very long chain fatty acids protein 6